MQQNFEKQVVSNVSQENVSKMGLSGLALHQLSPTVSCPSRHSHVSSQSCGPAWPLEFLLCVPRVPCPAWYLCFPFLPSSGLLPFSDLRLSLPISPSALHINPLALSPAYFYSPALEKSPYHVAFMTSVKENPEFLPCWDCAPKRRSPHLELGHSCLELPEEPWV